MTPYKVNPGKWAVSQHTQSVQIYEDDKPMEMDWGSFLTIEEAQRFVEAPFFQGNRLLHKYTVVAIIVQVYEYDPK